MKLISRILTFGWIAVSIVLDFMDILGSRTAANKLQIIVPCVIIVILLILAVKESRKEEDDREYGYKMETFMDIMLLALNTWPFLIGKTFFFEPKKKKKKKGLLGPSRKNKGKIKC